LIIIVLSTKTERRRPGPGGAAPLVRRLRKLSLSRANVLLTSPSSAGTELAARAYARLLERDLGVHNAAAFATEDQAATALFGLGDGVFTGKIQGHV
jgi:transcriptional regulator with AAA-type ATPase domain